MTVGKALIVIVSWTLGDSLLLLLLDDTVGTPGAPMAMSTGAGAEVFVS